MLLARWVRAAACAAAPAALLQHYYYEDMLASSNAPPPRLHALAPLLLRHACEAPRAVAAAPPTPTPESSSTTTTCYEEGVAFAVYTREGAPARLADVVAEAAARADVVLVGELHDDPVAHALELALFSRLLDACSGGIDGASAAPSASSSPPPSSSSPNRCRRAVALSLEMFERDVQGVMDEYLSGVVQERDLLRDARPWPNYNSDYRPLVERARRASVRVVCANAPRRYVSAAGRGGGGGGGAALAALRAAARAAWLAPLPVAEASARYRAKIEFEMREAARQMARLREEAQQRAATQQQKGEAQAGAHGKGGGAQAAAGQPADRSLAPPQEEGEDGAAPGECPYIGWNASSAFLEAQSLWDATMAHSIAQALQVSGSDDGGDGSGDGAGGSGAATSSPLVLHVCGAFHCQGRLGIPEHLARYAPVARVLVITVTPARDVRGGAGELARERALGGGDFTILTDRALPRSFDTVHPV